MNESRATPGASAGDGRVAMEGLSARYAQGAARRFRLAAFGLRFVGGYESRDGRLDDGQRLLAEARVAEGALRRIGFDGEAGTIGLTLRPLAAASGQQTRLLLMLGYREEGGAAVPFAEAFLAPAVFEALKADMLQGLAEELSLVATTNLWVRAEDRERPAGEPLDWYLGLDASGRATAPARGFIESIDWWPRPARAVSEVAYSPAPAVDHSREPDEDWDESSAEQLRKINWSFKQLLLLLAFLMIIVAMK